MDLSVRDLVVQSLGNLRRGHDRDDGVAAAACESRRRLMLKTRNLMILKKS